MENDHAGAQLLNILGIDLRARDVVLRAVVLTGITQFSLLFDSSLSLSFATAPADMATIETVASSP